MSHKMIWLVAIFPLLMLTGCGMNAADNNMVETLAQTRALGATIATVSDVDSARNVSPTIEGIGRRLLQLSQDRPNLGEVSSSNEHIVDTDLPNAQTEVAQRAAILQMQNPAAARIVGDALTRGCDPAHIHDIATTQPYTNLPSTVGDLPFLNTPLPLPLQQAIQRRIPH